MKAMWRGEYGGPEVLELRDVESPEPGPAEVLVRVRASSMNMADADYVLGRPWVARLGTGLRAPRAPIPGIDMAGDIAATGVEVSRFAVGDRVFADLLDVGSGAWAEYVAVPESALTPIPDGVSYEVAACVPSSGVFAIQGVRDKRPVRPGDEVLVNGASGNVGPFAVQIAKHYGAVVSGVCRTAKVEMVRGLGADLVIDYTVEDYRSSGKRYDLIIDIAAHGHVLGIRRSLKPGGGYVAIGGTARGYIEAATVGSIITLATDKRMGMLLWRVNDRRDMADLAMMLEEGAIRPVIDRIYPLADTADAMRYLESGEAAGKIVISV
jgi:NADPH:quinone reductase-like Zn-dependent oxidoreductase